MRIPIIFAVTVLLLVLFTAWYICRAADRRCRSRVPGIIARVVCGVLATLLVVLFLIPKRTGADTQLRMIMWGLFTFSSVFIPALIFVVFDLVSRVPQLFHRNRIKWLGITGAGVACFIFGAMWWGALVTVHRTDVRKIDIAVEGLPDSFEGYKIVQFSDFHTGTYGTDTSFVSRVVDDINALQADVVCFTGDIVNRRSEELAPFTRVLARLSAPDGVYSILGNHDYGDYMEWPDESAKQANLQLLKDMQASMGWRMLNNATDTLQRGDRDSIMLIGVENVGDPPFHTYGDLEAAYPGDLADGNVKILLSHNPAHWVDDIKDAPDKNIALTLSGHTHAMQMRFLGWSLAKFRYPTWGGLYDGGENSGKLYVNIGLGEVGFPARIGATPEITLITLHRK